MGTSAALFWLFVFSILFHKPQYSSSFLFFQWIGQVSLGVYCIHPMFYEPEIYSSFVEGLNLADWEYFIWAVIAMSLSLLAIWAIKKSRILSFALLGNPIRPRPIRGIKEHYTY